MAASPCAASILRDAAQARLLRMRVNLWKQSMPGALVADRAEVLVDAKHDQDEFGGYPRKDHPDDHAGDRGQQQDKSAEWADRHCGQPGKNAGDAEQPDQRDHQPVKGLDDGGRNEAVPLKQIAKFKHRSFSPGKSNISSSQTWLRMVQGLAPNAFPGKIMDRPERRCPAAEHEPCESAG